MSSAAKNAKQIFLDAIENHRPEEWPAYLDQAVGDDPQLRRRLEILLEAHRDEQSLLESPAVAPPTLDQPILERPGTQIGLYKLMEQIGEGGMGLVFVAEQHEPVRRKVALKIIKPGMDTREVIARFEAERQALALMDHPNIARVFDAGTTESGRPYFVMELVKGIPIIEYCDQQQLTARERLELFLSVCQAVQHAHGKGIIHRDLKPSNILVAPHDGVPVVKVIDFGVAKAIGQQLTHTTIYTRFTQMIGTPLYMSPEQAEINALDVDIRSDIYSLGVLLYELLTGTTPFERERFATAAYDEIRRIIREEEPPKPSTRLSTLGAMLASVSAKRKIEPAKLSALVKGELDWIVMRCLEKDRNRRYETANSLAQDIQRYLHDEPVHAGPPGVAYRLRKFARRHRGPVVAASLVLAALLLGILGTTFGLIRAERRRMEAERARADEIIQRGIAEAETRKSREAQAREIEHRKIAEAERLAAEQAEAEMLDAYRASTDDAIGHLIGSKPDLGPQEKAYLEKTLKRWQAFADRKGDDQRSRDIRAEGHFRVALLWQQLGRLDEARTEHERAREIWTKLAAEFPASLKYQQSLATTHNNLGMLLSGLGKRDEARAEFERARNIQQKLMEQAQAEPTYHDELGPRPVVRLRACPRRRQRQVGRAKARAR